MVPCRVLWGVPILLLVFLALPSRSRSAVTPKGRTGKGHEEHQDAVVTIEEEIPETRAEVTEDEDDDEGFFATMVRQALSYREEAGNALKDITTSIDGLLRSLMSAVSTHAQGRSGRQLLRDGLTSRQSFISSSLPRGPIRAAVRALFRFFNVLLLSQSSVTGEVADYLQELEIVVQEGIGTALNAPVSLIETLRDFIIRFTNNVLPASIQDTPLEAPGRGVEEGMTTTLILQLLLHRLDELSEQLAEAEESSEEDDSNEDEETARKADDARKKSSVHPRLSLRQELLGTLRSGALLDILRHEQRQANDVNDISDVSDVEALLNSLPPRVQAAVRNLYSLLRPLSQLFEIDDEVLVDQLTSIVEGAPGQSLLSLLDQVQGFVQNLLERFPFFPSFFGFRSYPELSVASLSLRMISRELDYLKATALRQEEANPALSDLQVALNQRPRQAPLNIEDVFVNGLATVNLRRPAIVLPPLPTGFDITSFNISVFNPAFLPPLDDVAESEVERPEESTDSIVDVVNRVVGSIFTGPVAPFDLLAQLSSFLFRAEAKTSSAALKPREVLDLLHTLDRSLLLALGRAEPGTFRDVSLDGVDFELFARTLSTMVVEITGIKPAIPHDVAEFLLPSTTHSSSSMTSTTSKPATDSEERNPRQFFDEGFFFDDFFGPDFFGPDFFGGGPDFFGGFDIPFLPDLLNPFGGVQRIIDLIRGLASFFVGRTFILHVPADQLTILSDVQELIHVFLESNTTMRNPVIAHVTHRAEAGRTVGGALWTPFALYVTKLLQRVFESTLGKAARATVPTEENELPLGPYEFRDLHCPTVRLAALTPGRTEFDQSDFEAFWRAYWVFIFTGGTELVTPCRTVGMDEDLERVPTVPLPSPMAFKMRVCPTLRLSLIDDTAPEFGRHNWDRFFFAYWSWLLTQGTMIPAQCYVRPRSGPFRFWPLPGIVLEHSMLEEDVEENNSTTPSSTPENNATQSSPFRPSSPIVFYSRFCLASFPLREIAPGAFDFRQDTFNRFWRSYFSYVLSRGAFVNCSMDGIPVSVRRSGPVLPLLALPPPALFARRTCPFANLLAVNPDSRTFYSPTHFHQFSRNYFNALIDPSKTAVNCLIDLRDRHPTTRSHERDQFHPLLGSDLRDEGVA